jgi:hypothetical protein
MPYAIQHDDKGSYRVVNTKSGKVHGSHMTKGNAENQLKLLNAIEHGYKPHENRLPGADGGPADSMESGVMEQMGRAHWEPVLQWDPLQWQDYADEFGWG